MALTDKLTTLGNAIRVKTGGTEPLTLDQMAIEIQSLSVGDGGTLTVSTLAGVTVTVSKDDKTFTEIANAEGIAVFKKLETGIWTVTISDGEQTSSKTVSITADYSLPMSFYHVYGISRDITLPSPEWAREDDAVGFTATASVGTTIIGHSDFDECYPWNGIVRETFDTGDVMVKIPKFWFKRYLDGNIEHIKIADKPLEGFTLHPAFNHANIESECIYVGAYRNYVAYNIAYSMPNKTPYCYHSDFSSRSQHRYVCRAKGANWHLFDIAALSAIQMLILVEFANNDVQVAIGSGWVNGSSTPNGVTGQCDTVANLTGVPAGAGNLEVVWRGIEGLWGYYFQSVDGIHYYNGKYYVCNDPSKYDERNNYTYDASAFTELSYTLKDYSSVNNSFDRYIVSVGVDTGNNSHVMMPTEASTTGSTSEYLCDSSNFYHQAPDMNFGGDYSNRGRAGIFALDCNYNNYSDRNSRLLYIPVKEVG